MKKPSKFEKKPRTHSASQLKKKNLKSIKTIPKTKNQAECFEKKSETIVF